MRRSGIRSGAALLLLVVVLVAAGGLGAPAGAPEAPGPLDASATTPAERGASSGAPSLGPRGPVLMARHAGGLELLTPSAAPILVGFHEASTPHAEVLEPVGRPVELRGRSAPGPSGGPAGAAVGASYVVMESRGRPFAPTSSIDVAVPEGIEVLAPVSGTVLVVESYRLYGRHDDVRIEIVPDDAPELRVVLIHLVDAAVAPGERIIAGESVIAASGRRLPFASQIDDEVGATVAHVHLEVQPIDAPRPFASG